MSGRRPFEPIEPRPLAGGAPRSDRLGPASLGPTSLPPSKSLDVVIVEDNPDVALMLRRLIELWGYGVEAAGDGRRGIDLILSRRPRVALVDIGLPELDGYAVARSVRAAPGSCGIRLIALTAMGRDEDRRLAFQSGFDAHLTKPARPEDLRKLLRAAWWRSAVEGQAAAAERPGAPAASPAPSRDGLPAGWRRG